MMMSLSFLFISSGLPVPRSPCAGGTLGTSRREGQVRECVAWRRDRHRRHLVALRTPHRDHGLGLGVLRAW